MWGAAEIILLPLIKITDDWRTFLLISTTIPSLLLNIIPYFLTESPKYLLQKNPQKMLETLK